MFKQSNFVTIFLAVIILSFAPACRVAANPPPGRLFKDIPRDGRKIHYLGKSYSLRQYRRQRLGELKKLKKRLKTKFALPFKTRYTKYFNIAYRCPRWKMNSLTYFLKKFMQQIYPRYFKYAPAYPFTVVYFHSKAVYVKKTGSGAYGFYMSSDKTLYTYAYSGHGTLWHEMIHAFVDANLKGSIQQWFSEGFASFYEMAFLRRGRVIDGYTNWRMPNLKAAIRTGRFVPFKKFLKQQYMRVSFGYAEARFLFCYLWVHRKMKPFVRIYIYELAPRYSGSELGEMAINALEKLTGKSLKQIEREVLAMARRVSSDQKLQRRK